MDVRNLITGFLVFALFVIAIVSFGVNFGTENDADVLITDNNNSLSTLYSGINSTIYSYGDSGEGIQSVANDSLENLQEEDPTIAGVASSILLGSITFIGNTIMGVANSIFNVTLNPLLKALGLPLELRIVITAILSTIMLFTITLLAWKLYRQGK